MNINIGYAVILPFHDFHLGGQTKVAYIKTAIKYKPLPSQNEEYKILFHLINSVNFCFVFVFLSFRFQTNVVYICIHMY